MRNKEDIKISSYEVEQRVFTYSYYVGEARRSSGLPLKLAASIQASSDDHLQLNDHMTVATSELVKIINSISCVCSHYTQPDEMHDGYTLLIFSLMLPQYFPVHLVGELKNTITTFLVMRILQQWFLQHKPDEATIIAAETEKIVIQLRELMNSRTKPYKIKRRTNNIEI